MAALVLALVARCVVAQRGAACGIVVSPTFVHQGECLSHAECRDADRIHSDDLPQCFNAGLTCCASKLVCDYNSDFQVVRFFVALLAPLFLSLSLSVYRIWLAFLLLFFGRAIGWPRSVLPPRQDFFLLIFDGCCGSTSAGSKFTCSRARCFIFSLLYRTVHVCVEQTYGEGMCREMSRCLDDFGSTETAPDRPFVRFRCPGPSNVVCCKAKCQTAWSSWSSCEACEGTQLNEHRQRTVIDTQGVKVEQDPQCKEAFGSRPCSAPCTTTAGSAPTTQPTEAPTPAPTTTTTAEILTLPPGTLFNYRFAWKKNGALP